MTTAALARAATARPCRRPAHLPPPTLRPGLAPPRRASSSAGTIDARTAALRAPPGQRRPASAGGGESSSDRTEPDALAVPADGTSSSSAPSLDGEIARLLLPALAAVFLEPAMQVVDTALVGGRLGTAALAALGLSNLVYFFATVLFSFLLVVTTPAVAAAEAKGDRAGSSAATARGLWVALGAGIAVGAALWLAAPTLLAALAPGPDVAAAAAPHLRARALAAPATLALFVANGAFRGHRDTATPLAAGAAQNGVHLALDVALLTRPGAALPWAAAAAAAGAAVGAAAMVGSLLARGLLRPADLARPPSLGAAVELLKPGAPLAACVGAVAAAVLGAANAASALGAAALAAHTVIKQVVDFALAVFGTFSTVSQTMVAAALGAVSEMEGEEDGERASESERFSPHSLFLTRPSLTQPSLFSLPLERPPPRPGRPGPPAPAGRRPGRRRRGRRPGRRGLAAVRLHLRPGRRGRRRRRPPRRRPAHAPGALRVRHGGRPLRLHARGLGGRPHGRRVRHLPGHPRPQRPLWRRPGRRLGRVCVASVCQRGRGCLDAGVAPLVARAGGGGGRGGRGDEGRVRW